MKILIEQKGKEYKMDDIGKKLLKEQLKEIEKENKEQIKITLKIFLEAYFKSLLIFGRTNKITQETIKIYQTIKKIIEEETKIHNFLRKNATKLDENAVQELLEILDDLNDETIEYYFSAFEDILAACDLKNEIYAKHKKKNFETLDETKKYKILTASLLITYQDIKKILNYEEEFWKYIEDKISFVRKEETDRYRVIIDTDENLTVKEFSATLPCITDYETTLTSIDLIENLYYLYTLKTKQTDEKTEVEILEKEKIKEYILKKFTK